MASSAITAAVNGAAMFLSVRYVSKIADKIEKNGKRKEGSDDKTTIKV